MTNGNKTKFKELRNKVSQSTKNYSALKNRSGAISVRINRNNKGINEKEFSKFEDYKLYQANCCQ